MINQQNQQKNQQIKKKGRNDVIRKTSADFSHYGGWC